MSDTDIQCRHPEQYMFLELLVANSFKILGFMDNRVHYLFSRCLVSREVGSNL